MLGLDTFQPEITHVSAHGLWLIVDDEEHHLPFAFFPWFKSATIAQLSVIERPSENHFYWPELDIDLALDSIKHPENYPLIAQ
jgi:Protein of unknown function (DUF2442)